MLTLLAVGCANPGPPRPPSLNLPAPVRDLQMQRVGNRVEATWTTPWLTTDKAAIPGPITAVLCLEVNPPPGFPANAAGGTGTRGSGSARTSSCVEVAQQAVSPGASAATFPLNPTLAVGPPRKLVYLVELRNAHGRSAGRSNAGWALAGAAPEAAGAITVAARSEGVLVTWKSAPPEVENGTMELLRSTLAAAPASEPPQSRSARKPPPFGVAVARPGKVAAAEQVRLVASGSEAPPQSGQPPRQVDPGGLLDHSVEAGATYSYVAQRVREVTLAGHVLRLLGEPSAPATMTYRDVFPPTAPSGLEAVPEGGFASVAGQPTVLSIDLSWEPSTETDVAGYNVYRSNARGQFFLLNSAPLPAPAYRDTTVQAGKRYRYRVTAVDVHHNESAPSADVEVQLQP